MSISALLRLWCVLTLCLSAGLGFAQAGLSVQIDSVGVGGLARRGDWTAVQVTVTGATEPADVVLRINGWDPDGDPAYYDRAVALSGDGRGERFWLYTRLPFGSDSLDRLTVSVFEAEPRSSAVLPLPALLSSPGERLATGEVPLTTGAAAPLGSANALTAVVGTGEMGLGAYADPVAPGRAQPPTGHELQKLALGLRVRDMPDRWQGWVAFDTVVWSQTDAERTPTMLSPSQAAALRRWVEYGGHLVVVLPPFSQPWGDSIGNPLFDMLPRTAPFDREDDASPEAWRFALTSDSEEPVPERLTLHTFRAAENADAWNFRPVLTLPDGRVFGVQRIVGNGLVTLIGIDLSDGSLRSLGLPRPDAIWHRVLGHRGELLTARDWREQRGPNAVQQRIPDREEVFLDRDIGAAINETGEAAQGVLLAVVLFALYWVIAGPGGYALLAKNGWKRHAWVAFVATAAGFTLLAWTGATALRPATLRLRYVAIVDQVHGQDLQRARVWSTVVVPAYGEALFSLYSDDQIERLGATGQRLSLLAPWHGISDEPAGDSEFPDNRPYRIDAEYPGAWETPARSTVKQVRQDWLGDARWSMPRPVSDPGDAEPATLQLVDPRDPDRFLGLSDRWVLEGELIHDLPGELTDIRVYVSRGQRDWESGTWGTRSVVDSNAYAFTLTGSWAPGERLDLKQVTTFSASDLPSVDARGYFDKVAATGVPTTLAGGAGGSLWNRLSMLAFYHQAEPAVLGSSQNFRVLRRLSTHLYDLGPWAVQPCVIITGRLEQIEGAGPTPLRIGFDGVASLREPPAVGTAIVRWVYPLPASPPGWIDPLDELEGAGVAPAPTSPAPSERSRD